VALDCWIYRRLVRNIPTSRTRSNRGFPVYNGTASSNFLTFFDLLYVHLQRWHESSVSSILTVVLQYTREHPWPSAIPTVCLASQYRFRDPSRKALSSLSSAMAQSMRKSSDIICSYTGFESDGLVIKADACVAGSDVVFLKDMNHSEPAIAVPGTKYPPGIVQEALMYLLIELVRRRSLSVHS